MKSFKQVLVETAKPRSRVLLFGRMNPPTRGHEENVLNAHALAQKHGAELSIVGSHTQDANKNPLNSKQKLRHLKRAFGHLPNTSISTSSPEQPNILNQATAAHKAGIKHLIIAGGGDRAAGHLKLLRQYNGVKSTHGFYKFDKISGVNTGERKEGISGTDMRKHVKAGNFDKFKANLPSKIAANENHSRELYHDVLSGMTHKDDFDRESYLRGQNLRLGTIVEDAQTGFTGRIVYRGPTYVTVQVNEELSFKRWIKDVDVIAEAPEPPVALINPFRSFLAHAQGVRDDETGAEIAAQNKLALAGKDPKVDPRITQNHVATMRKIRNFRKMED